MYRNIIALSSALVKVWVQQLWVRAAGRLLELPTRDAIPVNVQEQLIVELYSK